MITYPDEPFTSYFSGNTVQICPVGALTASPYRFRARPWDLDAAETSCQRARSGAAARSSPRRTGSCACSASTPSRSTRAGSATRAATASSGCTPTRACAHRRSARDGELVEASWPEALDAAAAAIRRALDHDGPDAIGVLGGARRHERGRVRVGALRQGRARTDNVDAQLGDGLPADVVLGLPRATIDDLDRAKAIVLLAPDLKEELPVLYLRVRRAAVELGVPLVDVSRTRHGLTPYATTCSAIAPRRTRGEGAAPTSAACSSTRSRDRDGPVVVVLGRAVGRGVGRRDGAGRRPAARRGGDTRFLSALRRANVHGALDLGLDARASSRARHARRRPRPRRRALGPGARRARSRRRPASSAAAARRRSERSCSLGCDPAGRLPRPRPRARRDSNGSSALVVVGAFPDDAREPRRRVPVHDRVG